jgi:hypothetical protein
MTHPMDTPPLTQATRTLTRIAPLKAGIMLAVIYGVLGLVIIPFFLLASALSTQLPTAQRVGVLALGAGFAIAIPILYAMLGFIGGVLCAFIYNVAARVVGGMEFDVE